MNRLSALVAPETIRTGSALLIGLTVAPLVGVLAATQPVLLLLLLGAAVWVFLVLRSDSSAPFVLGAAAPLMYLLNERSDLFTQAVLALFGMTFVHALHQVVYQPKAKRWDWRLVILVVVWGVIVVLAERVSLGDVLSPRRLIATILKMLPYFWFALAAPLLYLIDIRSALFSQAILALSGMAFIHAVHQIVHQPDAKRWNRRLAILVIAWGVIVVLAERVSLGDVLSPRRLIATILKMLPYFWFALAAPRITEKQAHALLAGITTGTIVTAAAFLLNSRTLTEGLQGRDAWIDTYTIIGSLKNTLGLLWVIGWILLIGWRTRGGWAIKAPLLAVLLAAILFSFSRSSYMALIAATLLLYRGRSYALWVAIGATCAFVLFGLPEAVWARLEMTWSPIRGFDPSAEVRIELWIAAINAFLSAPLTGIGWGKFSDYLVHTGQAPAAAGQAVYDLAYAHNYFLSACAMLGIGGGVLSVSVFLAAWQRARALIARQVHLARMVQAVLLAVALASLFGEPLFIAVPSFVFVLILACLVGQESER